MTKNFDPLSLFKKYRYQFFLFLIALFLFSTNYKPDTYLSGWDNLQTELNPWLGVKRALFSVWEEYQSFGLLAGMAHAADLVRAIFIWIVSFFLPQNLIRYFYHFLMLLLGGLGTFKLISQISKLPAKGGSASGGKTQNQNSNLKTDNFEKIAFLASLFYILNLGTIQIFYLPFEPFSTFFAFLPWGIWSFLKLISNIEYLPEMLRMSKQAGRISKKELLLFFLINLLGTPAFYVQQLFVVYLLILGLIILGLIFSNEKSLIKPYVLRSTFYVILILLINSFWLLPQIYFLKTSSKVVYEAKANQLATEDVYFQNREKGTLSYFLKLEGFYFDLFDKNNKPLFAPWKNHFKTFWPFQYFFAFLMILGLMNSLRKKDYSFIFPLILMAIVFLNATWPISLFDEVIRSNKFLNQIFRSPFTKFIIPYSLTYSYFLTKGLSSIKTVFKKDSLFLGLFVALIFIYSFPAFKGYFISTEMKVKIPKDYFEVVDYFKKVDKNKRIALLPEYTFWGWFFHRWGLPADRQGYNGSGFLWYGIEQPIASRTFDVWSDKSEGYFWEAKAAVEAEDLNRFEKVLEKYDIDYLLVDYSLLPVVGSMRGLQYDRINQLLSISKKISLVKKWPNIALYQVKNEDYSKDFISLKNNLLNIGPKIKLTDNDQAFFDFGDYYTDESTPDVYYPLLDLTTQTRLKNRKWQIKETEDKFFIDIKNNIDFSNYNLILPENKFQAILYQNDKLATYSGEIDAQLITDNHLQITFGKILLEKFDVKNVRQEECFKNTLCFSFSLPYLSQKYGYLIKIKNENLAGRRLFFYILDQTKKQSFIEDRLQKDEEYYLLPPKYQYGLGYSLVFHENSYSNLESKNKIIDIEVYLFPYDNLKSLRLISPSFQSQFLDDRILNKTSDLEDFSAKKLNYFTYQIFLPPISNIKSPISIYLSQSFHTGWKAYQINSQFLISNFQLLANYFPFLFGKELKEHVLINNWANGWLLSQSQQISNNHIQSQIVIFFWPQYLQFLGFGLLFVFFVYIFLKFKQ